MKRTVLFICTHNSARSQLAEGLVNHFFQNESCPYFQGKRVVHAGFKDPSDVKGTDEEKLAAFCKTRGEIKDWLFKNLNRISEELKHALSPAS